jgi:putative flippase GtrA
MFDLFRRLVTVMTGYGGLVRDIDFNLRRNRFMRFLIAGGINTLFGFAVFSVAIIAGAAVWLALSASTIAGTGFNFFTTGGYVFRELSLSRFPRFIIFYLLVYGINLGLIELLSMWLSDKILTQFILIFPMAVLSYFLMARFVFPKKKTASVFQQ